MKVVCRDPQKELVKLIGTVAGCRYGTWEVFSNYVEMAAISISNAIDLAQRDAREARYMAIVKGYRPEELQRFPEMLGLLVMALETEVSDVLGKTYHDLELHNKWMGQYFTPFTICQMMAQMTLGDVSDLEAEIAARGFVTAAEPSCGSGAMMLALAAEMRAGGVNYQQHLHITATDVDLKCVHMAFLQLSLLNIPAVVVHGNSLSLEEYSHWFTPAHILNGWDHKLRHRAELETPPVREPESLPPIKAPMIAPSLAIPTLPAPRPGTQLSLF